MADNTSTVPATMESAGGPDSKSERNPSSSNSRPHNGRGQGDRNNRGRGGGRGQGQGRGRGKGFGSKDRKSKGDLGRGAYERQHVDKRKRNEDGQEAKRRKIEKGGEGAVEASPFSKEEIEAESRKPKRKVAVMIGYAGSGYKGMQINSLEKTIEGDIFKAFVAAGAISKANADDPKKSSLVRCARTDKGVHAAGNVISLKLIVEEPNIVQTINDNLPPQIRVWGIERTNGSFSCYQTCDSRWYEYLIPTYSFIPPHPQSYLGKKLVESAEKEGVFEAFRTRQQDAATFWADAEDKYVKPILDKLDPEMRDAVMSAIHSAEEENSGPKKDKQESKKETVQEQDVKGEAAVKPKAAVCGESGSDQTRHSVQEGLPSTEILIPQESSIEDIRPAHLDSQVADKGEQASDSANTSKSVLTPLEQATKDVKAAYILAKKAYRISDARKARVQEALNCYIGTRNFHNYTIQKTFKDPSAKRVIRSFEVGETPIIINDTEWLSLKVHGQSFMMHQIRKMVAMVALVVRCGSSTHIIAASYGPPNISIPKAPGLGLLLERPVFDNYNERAVREWAREKIEFDKYKKEIDEFKQREIYDRIFREEERDHQFHAFFHHVDHYRTDYFLWVTASGISAASQSKAPGRTDDPSDDEAADVNGEEG